MEPVKNAVSSGQTLWFVPASTIGNSWTSIKIVSNALQLLSSVTSKYTFWSEFVEIFGVDEEVLDIKALDDQL